MQSRVSVRRIVMASQQHMLTSLLILPPRFDSIKVLLLQQLHGPLKVLHRQAQRLLGLLLELLLLLLLGRLPL